MNMDTQVKQLSADNDVISFRVMWNMIFRIKYFVIGFTLICSIGTVMFALSLPNIYRASAIYLPKAADSSGALSKLSGQFGGLASMAGISLGGSDDKTEAALEYFKSRSFLQQFIEKHDLVVPLLAAKGWDPVTKRLVIDADLYDENTHTWVRKPPAGMSVIPTAWEAYDELNKRISTSYQSKKGYVEVFVSYYSPEMAAHWLEWLIADLNEFWKHREHEQNVKRTQFLEKQAEKAQVSELKTVFYQLIAEQTKSSVLSEVTDEVILESMANVIVPEQKYSPSRSLLCLVGFFISLMISIFVSMVYCVMKPKAND
jgi:LPS O-antigen subunit length determinant protein (WzzB/FepE family)